VNEPFLDLMETLIDRVMDDDEERNQVSSREDAHGSFSGVGRSSQRKANGPKGLELIRGPVKRPERALQKLVRVYGRDVGMLTDLVRCTVLADDLEKVEALLEKLHAVSVVGQGEHPHRDDAGEDVEKRRPAGYHQDGKIFRITVIKNRLDTRYDDSQSAGYRDLSMNVEVWWSMKDGLVSFEREHNWDNLTCSSHICEIQVRLRSQHHNIVQGGLHNSYVELRNVYNT